jgi:hypothetical protein
VCVKVAVFSGVVPYSFTKIEWPFRVAYCLHHQDELCSVWEELKASIFRVEDGIWGFERNLLPPSSEQKIVSNYKSIWHYCPEDLHGHCIPHVHSFDFVSCEGREKPSCVHFYAPSTTDLEPEESCVLHLHHKVCGTNPIWNFRLPSRLSLFYVLVLSAAF